MASLGFTERLKRAFKGASSLPAIDPELAAMEHVVRVPPLTPELVGAIRLIAPHYQIEPGEKGRLAWEADQNAACWGEYLALQPILDALPSPKRVLEIGPGLGRSIIFFSRKCNWSGDDIHVYEGEGSDTKYTMAGPRFEDSFCGNLKELGHVLDFNGISNVAIHDAKRMPLGALPGPFDLIYSFYSIGFHWALDHFLDDIMGLLAEGGTAIFTLAPGHELSARVRALDHKVVVSRSPLRKRSQIRLIVLRK